MKSPTVSPITVSLTLLTCVLSLFLLTEPALAATGGLTKVNDFMENVLNILHGVSITVVTIAIMWAGYKFFFKHADIGELAKILGGGLLVGGAAEIAAFMLG